MNAPPPSTDTRPAGPPGQERTGARIAAGLILGVACGVFFGEYCGPLQIIGLVYVGLLQMTVLPYLAFSLIAKLGRLDWRQARDVGLAAAAVLLALSALGVVLIVVVSSMLPPTTGAAFFSSAPLANGAREADLVAQFVPANIFRSLSNEYVPAVVVFCLFFGTALMAVPGKEPLLQLLDVCSAGVGRINTFLIKLAPIGLFMLTAAAAGTLRLDELAQLQAYLILFTLACLTTALVILPLLAASLTDIRYRDLLRAAQEPLLTAIATGKLFVVLPQLVERCETLVRKPDQPPGDATESIPDVVVPLMYPFPHLGKILTFIFISFAAWYVGKSLSPGQTAAMGAAGAVSSFASPLVSIPNLLDAYQLPQDLLPLFILPGFITMRLGDVVGVMHLMTLTVIVSLALQGRLRVRWGRLAGTLALTAACLAAGGGAARAYLVNATLEYDLDKRLLSLEVPNPHQDVVVYRSRQEAPPRVLGEQATMQRIKTHRVLRVGYHPDHLPYTFFNRQRHLVGLDVELLHRLARRLNLRLEFVPYAYDTVTQQLNSGEIDLVIGGLMVRPEILIAAGCTQPYQAATLSIVLPDHRREEVKTWSDRQAPTNLRLGVVHEDLASVARRELPAVEIVVIDSFRAFFEKHDPGLDGLIMAAEEGAAWNVLYPEYAVIVPEPVARRPVSMAVRSDDLEWLSFLNRWLDFERMEGSLDRLREYWVEGAGARERKSRWSIVQNVLQWLP